jgi:hypothetical protein
MGSQALSDNDGTIEGQATITLSANTVTIVLESLVADPTGAGQLISGIVVNFASGTNPGTATFASTPTGTKATIGAGGSFTQSTINLNHWGLNTSGNTVTLATAGTGAPGGKPVQLIIGPTSDGTYNTTGKYDEANSSIVGNHYPIEGPVTFTLTVPGITSTSSISSVGLEFGTGPDMIATVDPGVTIPAVVPEPSTFAGAAFAVVASLAYGWRRTRSAA